jgi:MFS transporter, DHA1 family, inner membrane transport protein
MMILGTLGIAVQYPLLAEVDGVGVELLLVCVAASIGEVLYWPSYNAYFAAIGDAEHRGHQVSARMALVSVVSIVAPILGTWALVTLGPRSMFAAVGVVQALAIVPIIGAPNVAVRESAPGAFRAARLGVILYAADGWLDAWFILVWQIALFISLGESFSAYGGAMALAALVGAGCGLILGRHVDQGHGRRTVVIAYTVATAIVLMRASSFDSAWLAVTSHALGAFVLPLIIPAQSTASYNLAKASPCPMRFIIACEAGWDVGCASGCLLAAALAMMDIPLSITILLALPALAVLARVLRQYFANGAEIPIAPPTNDAGLPVRDGA